MVSSNGNLSEDDRRKKAAIDRIVNVILDYKVDDYAEVLLDVYGRFEVLGQTSYMTYAPILTAVFGKAGLDIADVLGLNPREGTQLILKRLKEVKEERESQKIESENEKSYDTKRESLWFKFKIWFSTKILFRKNK